MNRIQLNIKPIYSALLVIVVVLGTLAIVTTDPGSGFPRNDDGFLPHLTDPFFESVRPDGYYAQQPCYPQQPYNARNYHFHQPYNGYQQPNYPQQQNNSYYPPGFAGHYGPAQRVAQTNPAATNATAGTNPFDFMMHPLMDWSNSFGQMFEPQNTRTFSPLQVPEIGMEVLPNQSGGITISRVYGGSHANRAGLRKGDILVKYANNPLTSPSEFFRAMSAASPEMTMRLRIMRSGRMRDINVLIGKRELDGVTVPADAAPAHPFALPG